MDLVWLEQVETWHDFYVIIGGSAAGLTGLMFVVRNARDLVLWMAQQSRR